MAAPPACSARRRSDAAAHAVAVRRPARCAARLRPRTECNGGVWQRRQEVMRRIVHLSDVHFGRTDPGVVGAVLNLVRRLEPHLVAISGDLTQRARGWQFRETRGFLDALPCPQLVVPGNHDVPLYDIARRFLDPLGNYTRHITTNLRPVHTDPEIVVVGLNTTRSFTVKDGTIRPPDLRHARDTLERAGNDVVKIVVAHHPFEYPEDSSTRARKAAAVRALEALAAAGTDVFLSGHLHLSY